MAAARRDVDCDVLVVGGGINGAGIARDVAGRGLCVALCERDDLAAHTSSASTKLIHGGLRYLEHYEFGLVRKALAEREVLLRAAPHVIRPMRFVMPHTGQRSAALIRAGLFLYDRLARRELLPGSASVQLADHPAGRALKPALGQAFVYSDGWVDDARLVVLNAVDAAQKGACILTRTACTEARRDNGAWRVTLRKADGTTKQIAVRAIVNAAGPWAGAFLDSALGSAKQPTRLRLVKGSHIVVRRLFDHDDAYLFQHADGRIVFAIPYEREFTLIGTTDVEYSGDPAAVAIAPEEIRYLCAVASHYFRTPVAPADVVWSFAGVRPLLDDASARASAVTRDYRLQLDGGAQPGDAPLLTVFGGKLTTYRKLAEEGADLLCKALGHRAGAWTAGACLPGGDLFGAVPQSRSVLEFDGWRSRLQVQYDWLDCPLIARYARAYGTRIHTLLQGRASMADMGEQVLPGLYEAELDYLRRHEWAVTAEDILWRRTKLGLHLPAGAAAQLDAWLTTHPAAVLAKTQAKAQAT